MTSFLSIFTAVSILYQTLITTILGWLVLACRLGPRSGELQEVTLMKLLYLHDPSSCGKVFFYNHTTENSLHGFTTTVVWPTYNLFAYDFRIKIQVWVVLHLLWAILCVSYMIQGHGRPYSFFAILLPFTLVGVAILLVDLLFCGLFLADVKKTASEHSILKHIKTDRGVLRSISKTHQDQSSFKMRENVSPTKMQVTDDTSWIALLFSYVSCRGVVQWVINFWIVKDNYFEGLAAYRRYGVENPKMKAWIQSQMSELSFMP